MLYLSDKEVTKLIDGDMPKVVELMRDMFLTMAEGDYVLGGKNNGSHGMRISFGEKETERIFLAMPGYLGGKFNMAGMKWHGPSVPVPGNEADSYFIMVLNDIATGKPVATMRADTLTRYRTAAVNALAVDVLSHAGMDIVAVIGPGRITELTMRYLLKKNPDVREVRIKGRGQKSITRFTNVLKSIRQDLVITICGSVKEAVEDADITIINTGFHFDSYADMPIIKSSWGKEKSVFVCSAFASFPDSMIINNAVKVCDLYDSYETYQEELGYPAYKVFGSIGNRFADLVTENKLKKQDIIDLSDLIAEKKHLDEHAGGKIIFSSNGLVLEDIALASYVYKKAKNLNVGMEVE